MNDALYFHKDAKDDKFSLPNWIIASRWKPRAAPSSSSPASSWRLASPTESHYRLRRPRATDAARSLWTAPFRRFLAALSSPENGAHV